ncbi:hypothetical protein [Propionivibrio sp.]|uniref:hypothetical protein n=1 Tax=Propionivibrio sp. TaxID=2212460 RepID=UPI00260695C0|nr:hypothetical protein [Propionivibrio sp.]
MKTSLTFRNITLVAFLGAALAAPVGAQGGPGMGGGMGGGPGMQNGGPGPGMGRGGREMMFDRSNVRGWALMTAEERTAFQTKMRAVGTYDQCKRVQAEHRSTMESRARDKGVNLMAPRANACDNMKSRGFIK